MSLTVGALQKLIQGLDPDTKVAIQFSCALGLTSSFEVEDTFTSSFRLYGRINSEYLRDTVARDILKEGDEPLYELGRRKVLVIDIGHIVRA